MAKTIFFYCKRHRSKALRKHLEKENNILTAKYFGWNALHYAIWCGSKKCLLVLLENGGAAIINDKDDLGWTPLHISCLNFGCKYASILLKYGADINATCDCDGNTLLHGIARLTHTGKCGKLLLENGADPTIKNNKGETPLHIAIMHFSKLTKLLIFYGADISIKDDTGKTALEYLTSDKRRSQVEKWIQEKSISDIKEPC